MTSAIQSKGVPLTSILSPYQSGTTKQRTTGIQEAGVDICNLYANVIYGTEPAATGIASESDGLETLFCTGANYSLPINGQTYGGSGHAASGLVTASVVLNINNTQYEFVGSGTGSPGNTWPYSIPSGVTQYAYKVNSGSMSAWTNIPSSGTFVLVNSISASSNNTGTKTNTQTLTLYFGNGGTAVYSGTCTMTATADSGA